MKTAAEWVEIWAQGPTYRTRSEFVAWVQKVLDDARAGMVTEGELAEAKAEGLEHWNAFCDSEQRRVDAEAELAKAWEAGRDAAAKLIDKRKGRWTTAYSETPDAFAIRALQPPGGKAK